MGSRKMRWLWIACVGCAWDARAESPSPAGLLIDPEAREVSTSLGFTNGGQLVRPQELPLDGEGWEVMPHIRGRGTNFGTDALVRLIRDAAGVVRARWPDAVLAVGNLGYASGEKIPWSVSHQAGRDADLGMFGRDGTGRPLRALPFVKFDAAGEASHRGATVRFDTERNLALVTALVMAPGSRVQYIFVAAWLKALLLDEARRQGLTAELLGRLDAVLLQPSDSSPHDDHFHVRLFCTVDDRLHGCQDRGPRRDWVPMGDEVVEAFIDAIGPQLGPQHDKKHALRVAARLKALRHPHAAPHLLRALSDRRAPIREAALDALSVSGAPEASRALLEVLPTVTTIAWFEALVAAAESLADEEALPRLLALARDPDDALGVSLRRSSAHRRRASRALGSAAARVALRRLDPAVTRLPLGAIYRDLAALARGAEAGVARDAHQALRALTCHLGVRRTGWGARVADLPVDPEGRLASMGQGLRAWRKSIPAALRSRGAVARLLPLTGAKDDAVRVCVSRALAAVTGHAPDPFSRPPHRYRRHWEHWWRTYGDELALPR